jgi:hypothetical protein
MVWAYLGSGHRVARFAAVSLVLGAHGIGPVRFGTPKPQAVAALSRVLGRPTSRTTSPGCGARYTEVFWGDLEAEFRLGTFSGYRYLDRGELPPLATAKGITIGSTLAQVRAAYGRLGVVGTDRWRAPNGLVFYDDAMRDPIPPSSRIIEIKIGTCGDY